MIGRAADQNPALLLDVDPIFFGEKCSFASRESAVEAFFPYIEERLAEGVPLHAMTRHVLGLFNGLPGARAFRRHLAEEAIEPGADADVLRGALQHVGRAMGGAVQSSERNHEDGEMRYLPKAFT